MKQKTAVLLIVTYFSHFTCSSTFRHTAPPQSYSTANCCN